jgi:uncharacterized iron-regulated membrane protein
MPFRKVIFWIHLAVGLTAGLVIAVMCLTGAALAFEKQLVGWAERDARLVALPVPGAPRLSLDELQKKFREARPDGRASALTVTTDPREAVVFSLGREGAAYVNPYSGEVRQPASAKMRDLLRVMTDLHRWLALSADNRATGKAITGACNLAFCFLALSGLFLWWPRKWRTKGLKRSLWFLRDATGHARDWNWHNVTGFWLMPVLVVLTASGAVLSYRWAGNLVYQAAGETPPAPGGPGRPDAAVGALKPPTGARPLDQSALLAVVEKILPNWETITLHLGGGDGEARTGPSPATFVIKEPGAWPRTATTTLSLDPFTGEVLKRERFADLTTGRRARTWLRFLHTGEALGLTGQFIAGLACVGGCFLVYTGFALAWRRFFHPKSKNKPTPIPPPLV